MNDLRPAFAGLEAARMLGWLAMSARGQVRQHRDGRWYVDFGHGKRVWTLRIGERAKLPLTEDLGNRVLELVRGELSRGKQIDEALAQFQPSRAVPNLVRTRLDRWLEVKRREVQNGDRSPTYYAELERYADEGGHFSWWDGRSILEVNYATLEDWSAWLADRGLGPKTRWNVLAAFRSFLGWLYKRDELSELPREFPWPKVPEHEPATLSMEAQGAILEAIPGSALGIFLCLALLGLRPSEAVSLRAGDASAGWLMVARARKGPRLSAPEGATKTGQARRLPIPPELQDWIAQYVPQEGRLTRSPLFVNPRTGRPWAKSALRRTWEAACTKVGVRIGLYNGTKHTMATDAIARGVPERSLQAMLGHSSPKSTRRYARLADQALIEVLKR